MLNVKRNPSTSKEVQADFLLPNATLFGGAHLLLKQGVHPKIVSERLDHSSIQMTLDTYTHLLPNMQEAAAAGFDQMLK